MNKYATTLVTTKEGGVASPYAPVSIPTTSLPHFMLQKLASYGDKVALVRVNCK